jgi:hypothetical protein
VNLDELGYSDNFNGKYTFIDSATADVWTSSTNNSAHDIPPGDYHPSGAGGPVLLPSNSLATFNGEPLEGTWELDVFDFGVDFGNITSFAIINLTPRVCPPGCGTADFNCDGDLGTDADIVSFFTCLAGTCPPPPCTSSADFNGDGDIGTDADIESFFRVLAGGPC